MNNCDILVSIIVPTYQPSTHLFTRCIDSLRNQTYLNTEIIIVNDGTPNDDPSNKIIDHYSAFERIRVIKTSNEGVSCARNKGLEAASGSYVIFIDHDDYVNENYIETLVGCIDDSTDMVVGGFTEVDANDNVIRIISPSICKKLKSYSYSFGYVWIRLVRRSFLLDNHIHFPEGKFLEDSFWNIWCNALARRIVYCNNSGYFYVRNALSQTALDKFASLSLERLPLEEMKNLLHTLSSSDSDSGVMTTWAVTEMFSVMCSSYCRKNTKDNKKILATRTAEIVRTYCPKCLKSTCIGQRRVSQGIIAQVAQIVYCLCVKLHLEIFYTLTFSSLYKFISRV